jgi:hypothetical protein
MEVVEGKETAVLKAELDYIPGRENVRWVALDLSDGYRNFAREFSRTPSSSLTSFTSCD